MQLEEAGLPGACRAGLDIFGDAEMLAAFNVVGCDTSLISVAISAIDIVQLDAFSVFGSVIGCINASIGARLAPHV